MFCKNCGKANPDNQRFCSGCGADLMGGAPGSMNTPQSSGFNTSPNFNQGFGFGNNGINMNTTNSNGKGFAIASLVLGIVSFFCFGIIAGALAIIFGYVAKNKGSTSPMATAGIVCGLIGAGLALLLIILSFSGLSLIPTLY